MARVIIAVLTLVTAVLIEPRSGEAAPYWPWCSRYQRPTAVESCAFSSYEQCMETVFGIGGWCYKNPYPPPVPAPPAKSIHRRTSNG